MQRTKTLLAALLAAGLLAGCAAMGVPATSDPGKKLAYAETLYTYLDRPLPAERLIHEAIAIYREREDDWGVAYAYRTYGFFLISRTVAKHRDRYVKHGFLDKTITFDKRFVTALAYFEKSRAFLEAQQDLSMLANVYIGLAATQLALEQKETACTYFDRSIAVHKELQRREPSTYMSHPKEYASFEDAVADFKKDAGCNV